MNSEANFKETPDSREAPLARLIGGGMQEDVWAPLRKLTSARIALGRSRGSMPTRHQLDFQLAHACARDAVWSRFDPDALAADLRKLGLETMTVESAARDRAEFLQRPDLGRRLATESRIRLLRQFAQTPALIWRL